MTKAEMSKKWNLDQRFEDMKSSYTIRKEGNDYTVNSVESYLSDSFNPAGEWAAYERRLKSYKSLKSATNYLVKIVKMNFPANYLEESDISELLEAMIKI